MSVEPLCKRALDLLVFPFLARGCFVRNFEFILRLVLLRRGFQGQLFVREVSVGASLWESQLVTNLLSSLSGANEDCPRFDRPYPVRQCTVQDKIRYTGGAGVCFGCVPAEFPVGVE